MRDHRTEEQFIKKQRDLHRWEEFRLKREDVMDKQANYRKKTWLTKSWISHIICLPILLHVSRNITYIDELNKKNVFKGLIARRFQRLWKTFIERLGPSSKFKGEISILRDSRKI